MWDIRKKVMEKQENRHQGKIPSSKIINLMYLINKNNLSNI